MPFRITDERTLSYVLIFVLFAIMILTAFYTTGTADEGDSIGHYLLAQSAWHHPYLYFDHWGKPFFTLCISVFAQLSFKAVQMVNAMFIAGSLLLAVQVGRYLSISNLWMLPLLFAAVPLYYVNTLSGLTEPMFNFWLIAGIFLLLKNRHAVASTWLSFLPFIRSEGLIVIFPVALYLFLNRSYWSILLLAAGHLVYSVAGYLLMDKPLLWIFTEITYASFSSNYGKGTWDYFFIRSPEIFGYAGTVLFACGIFYRIKTHPPFQFKKARIDKQQLALDLLIFGIALSVFLFHVAAWAMGWFQSYGLRRVFLGVSGLILLIQLYGLNHLLSIVPSRFCNYAKALVVLIALLIPWLGVRYGYEPERQFSLKAMQRVMESASETVKEYYPDYKSKVICYEAPHFAFASGLDFYDKLNRIHGYEEYRYLKPGTLLIWDEWYMVTEGRTPYDSLIASGKFRKVAAFKDFNESDEVHSAIVFETIK